MKHLIVYAHPNGASLNGQIKNTVESTLLQKGHQVVVRNLNELGFNPVLSSGDILCQLTGTTSHDIAVEQQFISWADCITFIYPIWWTGMPAIMKGYIDRVFTYGFAYRYDKGVQKGLLTGKSTIIINTHGKSKQEYEQNGMHTALLMTSDKGIFEYCGFDVKQHLFFDGADRAYTEKVENWKQELTTMYNN